MAAVEGIIALSTGLTILFFLLYVVGILRLPSGQRPATPTYDRLGRALQPSQNPGFQETEDERQPE